MGLGLGSYILARIILWQLHPRLPVLPQVCMRSQPGAQVFSAHLQEPSSFLGT